MLCDCITALTPCAGSVTTRVWVKTETDPRLLLRNSDPKEKR